MASEPTPELLAACRAGDREALGRLIDEHLDMVHAAAFALCADRALAADLAQEVFVKVLTRIGQFRGDASFATWLYGIALNTWRDHARRTRRRSEVALESTAPSAAGKAETLDVRRALQRLPRRLRAAVALRYGAELTYDEIARALGVPSGTAASRVHRGLRELGRMLR
jgi:RNA polymerase sigma-70 factor (ECF subfamily)